MDSPEGNKPAQTIIAKEGSTVKNVIQAIIHLPAWAWITGAVILAISLLLGSAVFNIEPLQGLLPTPTAFAAATEGQSLIIVADFEDRSGGKYEGIDPAQYVYEQLLAQVQNDNLDIRIERLRQVVDDNSAKPTGETYNGTMVIWGWYDALTITPRMTRIKTLEGKVSDNEGARVSISDPEKIEFSVVTDLPNQTTYLVMFTLGMDKFSNNNFDVAVTYFNNAIESVLNNESTSINPSEAYFFRGNIYRKKGKIETAIADYSKAIDLSPNDIDIYNNRGIAYAVKEEYDFAIADYEKAINLEPQYFNAYVNRGIAYYSIGKTDLAIVDFDRAIELKPPLDYQYFLPYLRRGLVYYSIGEYDRAIADYDRALSYNNLGIAFAGFFTRWDEAATIHTYRGIAYQEKGDYDNAITDYTKAIEYAPEFAYTYIRRGNIFFLRDDYNNAITDYTRAIELDSKITDAYIQRGIVYIMNENYNRAIDDFNKVIEIDSDNVDAYLYRGLVLGSLGQIDGAIKDYEHFLEISTDPELRKMAGEELKKLKGQ